MMSAFLVSLEPGDPANFKSGASVVMPNSQRSKTVSLFPVPTFQEFIGDFSYVKKGAFNP